MSTGTQHAMSSEMQDCISNCMTCHAVCLETISQCLQIGGEHASAQHIGLLQDCVQTSGVCSRFGNSLTDKSYMGSDSFVRTGPMIARIST